MPGPLTSHWRLCFVIRTIRFHGHKWLSHSQDVPVFLCFRVVASGLNMNFINPPEDWMVSLILNDVNSCALCVIFSVMPNPALSRDLMTEPSFVIFAGVAKMVFIVRVLVVLIIEPMG